MLSVFSPAVILFGGVLQNLAELNWPGLLFQLFLGYIPQGFAILLFIHVFMGQRIAGKKFLLTGLLMGLTIFVVRSLPINFGVHTILNILILIGICCGIHKFPLIKTCIGSFLVMIFLYLLEGISYMLIQAIFGKEFINELKIMGSDPIKSAPAWMPPSLAFVVIVLITYLIFSWKKARQDAKNIREDRVEH